MIDNQQLFKFIPKHIADWTPEDVVKWFQVNDIQLDSDINLNGSEFLDLTPKKLINQFKLSSFLARKISQWIESQTQEFDEFVDQAKLNQPINEPSQQNQSKSQALKQQVQMKWSDQSLEAFKNVEMDSNLLKKEVNKKQKVKSAQKPLRFLSNQSQQSQIYQPFKYKQPKYSQKKKQNVQKEERHLQSIKSQPFLNGKHDLKGKLVLEYLQENDDENRQDAQTCNHIPDDQSDYFESKRKPLKKICSQNCLNQPDLSHISSQSQFSNHVKFVSSQLMMGGCPVLIAQYGKTFIPVTKSMKVGRNSANDIILRTDGVSRNHAQILVEQWPDVQGQIHTKYFIKDIGSKFGTFIEVDPQKPRKVFQNDSYSIGQTTIRVEKVKLHKSKQKFDITVCLCLIEEERLTFSGKSIVTVGSNHRESQMKEPKNSQITKRCTSKEKRDIEIDDNEIKNYHCRFAIINGEVYLEQVEGNILERIQKNVKFELSRNKYQVKFGDDNVVFKIEQVYKPVSYRSQ